jgi:hypothetical protein
VPIDLDEDALVASLASRMDGDAFRAGIAKLASDRFFLAFFLMSVSQGEGLGEAAVGMIGEEELARRIRELDRQRAEEHAHMERTLDVARDLFPEAFDGDAYRHPDSLMGRRYYVTVLEANRKRLAELGRKSRLNVYLTTTFGYEVMVALLYRAVADAVAAEATLPEATRRRIGAVLESILAEEATHLGVVDQHNALLDAPRGELSAEARAMLDSLGRLEASDYVFAAELAVEQVVATMERYAEGDAYRREIEAGGEGASAC